MNSFLQDLRYAVRQLQKNPGFTITAVLTLALGIGANTAIFSVINALLLKTLPVRNPAELVVIGDPARIYTQTNGTPQVDYFSYPLYRVFRDNASTFSGMLVSGAVHRTKVGQNDSEIADNRTAVLVSGNYFSVLGVNALIGRTLTPEDDDAKGKHPVAVISFAFWREKLGQDPNVVGRTIALNGYPFTVIGVAPPGFFGDAVGDPQDFWVPMMMQEQLMPGRPSLENWNRSWLHIIARLKPESSLEQARANVNLVFKQFVAGPLGAALPEDDRNALGGSTVKVEAGGRGFSYLRGEFFAPLLLLMTIVGLVLLIACVNVTNLLLSRASTRQREIAVRLAIGASRVRLIRQLLTESVLLGLLGGVCGVLLAQSGTRILVTLVSASSVGAINIQPDLRVLGFTAAVCLVAGVLLGLIPALKSLRLNVAPSLKNNSQQLATDKVSFRFSWGKVLVASQVSLSLLVLFAASLLVRTMSNLKNLDLGYSREHLLLIRTDPVAAGYTGRRVVDFANATRDRLAALPGINDVTLSKNGLFSGSDSSENVKVEGYVAANDDDKQAHWDWAGPNYFHAVGIPLLRGRDIAPEDTAASPKVAVINETMSKFYFGNSDPIGRRIWMDDSDHRDRAIEIVGVARDARGMELRGAMERRFYMPFAQTYQESMAGVVFIVRTNGDPSSISSAARKVIADSNPNVTIVWTRPVTRLVEEALSTNILIARLSSFFGVLALLLASVGLYGVMSYSVSSRTKEIGLRMAMGAPRQLVLRMVLGETMLLTFFGLALGIPAALAATRMLRSMLFGLSSADPWSLTAVCLVLYLVASLAGLVPARRAAGVDPMVALRYE
jgi:predicted permease